MIEIIFMVATLLASSYYVNNGLRPRGVFSSSSAFLIGNWFFIIFNALLTTTGHAERWGESLLEDNSLYTFTSVIVIVGLLFFTLGNIFSSKPKFSEGFSIKNLTKKDKLIILISGFIFFIPGNWAVYYTYNETLNSSYWDRTTSIVSISNLIIPSVLIGVIGLISSYKRSVSSSFLFGAMLFLSTSGLLLLWSRRPVLGMIFTVAMVLFAQRKGKPGIKPLFYLFPVLIIGAMVLSFYRSYVFFDVTSNEVTIAGLFNEYFRHLWLESSAFSALMYSAGPALENELLLGSSFLAAFIFFIPRSIFPDKPLSYELASQLGNDLNYNLPASFYGEAIANFGLLGVPILAFLLGYYLKKIDHMFYSKPRNIFELGIYILFAFNMFFMVRGSFSTVVSAAVIMCLLPLLMYLFFKKVKTNYY